MSLFPNFRQKPWRSNVCCLPSRMLCSPGCLECHSAVVSQTCDPVQSLDDVAFGNKSFLLSQPERMQVRTLHFQSNQLLTQLARHFHLRGMPYFTFFQTSLSHAYWSEHLKVRCFSRLAWCFQGRTLCPFEILVHLQ